MSPKKLKQDNTMKIESLFGNMIKDSKKQPIIKNETVKSPKKVQKTDKNSTMEKKEGEERKKSKSKKMKNNQKEKIKLTEEEKDDEKKSEKNIKKNDKKSEKNKDNNKEFQKKNKKKKKLSKKNTSDSESFSLSKEDALEELDKFKMEIEEEEDEKEKEKEQKSRDKNKSKSKSKSKSRSNKKSTIEKKTNKDKIIFDEEEFEIPDELKDEIIDFNKEETSDKKESKKESIVKQSTRKKSSEVKSAKSKSTSNKRNSRKDSSSNGSNIIDGPLSSETIVITGEFDIKRDQITNILKSLGARVTGSVSSRTSILLHGEVLEDGRPYNEGRKYKLAMEKNITTMDLYTFEKFVQDKIKNPNWTMNSNNKNDDDIIIEEEASDLSKDNQINTSNQQHKHEGELWTTKYHPKKVSDLIGNKTNINKLIQWLDDWNSVVLEGKKKKVETKFIKGQRPTFDNVNARACLITGDPGIGKTSSVRLIAKLKGYKVYETNASDQRNKSSINKNAGFMFDNKTLFGGELQEKNLIIMDEVDGMSGNEDRGGIAAIIDIIKKTKTPIICIANDRQSPKLKTLANYCYDLKFVHPDKRAISVRLTEICKKENIQCEMNALEYLCEICGNDIRQIINYLEIWSKTHKSLKFSDISGDKEVQGKDEVVMLKNFDAAKELLNSKSHTYPFRKLLDLYFIDYDLIPLLIQENYLSTFPSQNFKSKKEELESISIASDLISESDVIDKRIRSQMDWRMLADRGLLGCCTICKLNRGFVPFPKFPEALGKISSLNKIKRETAELKECFSSASGEEIRRNILPVLYTFLTDYLIDGNIEGALELMKNYHISMDIFKENMTDLVEDKLKSSFDKIGTTNKSNLTRAYNKNFKTSIIRNKNKKGKNKTSVNLENQNVYDENGNPINEIENENEEENDEEDGSEIVVNTKGKSKTQGKSKNKKSQKKNGKSKSKSKNGKNKKKKGKKSGDDESEEEYNFNGEDDDIFE